MKKGQISLFIIIAMIIAVVIIIIFIAKSNVIEGKVDPEIIPINNFFENCIQNTGEIAIYTIGQSGGYFSAANYSTDNGIAYYYDKGKNFMLSKARIEEEISLYVDKMLFYCTKEVENFSGYIVKQGESKTKAKIEEGKVVLDVKCPLSISKNNKYYTINKFQAEIPVRLDEIYNLAQNITLDEANNPGYICVSCISEKASQMDLYVEMNEYDSETIIFTIRDEKSQINNLDYRFNFANKYDFK